MFFKIKLFERFDQNLKFNLIFFKKNPYKRKPPSRKFSIVLTIINKITVCEKQKQKKQKTINDTFLT